MTAGSPRGGSADPLLRLRGLGPPFLGLVVIEFLLGMSLNLLVSLPAGSPTTVLASSPLLDVHVAVGVLLLGIAANALRFAVAARGRWPILVATLGLTSGFLAFGAGLAFAFGDPSAVASYLMSLGFAGLLLEAGYLLSLRGFSSAFSPAPGSAPGEA